MTIESRRNFLKLAFGTAAYAAVAGPLAALNAKKVFGSTTTSTESFGPMSRIHSAESSRDFNGDEIDRPHEILWDKDNYLRSRGGIPEPTERTAVVIVGGGMAGLMAAYRLRHLSPVILEGARRLGGNSKGEALGAAEYSIGAAYVARPDADSPIERFLRELGVRARMRAESEEDATVAFGGKLVSPFWSGATDPANRAEFERVARALARVRDEAFPEIPFRGGGDGALSFEQLVQLDRMSLEKWVATALGRVHPHIEEFFHQYCWSSFAMGYDEVSAAHALNFLTGDMGGILAIPGGNAAIAQAIYDRLPSRSPRPGALVIDVSLKGDGVRVCYETPDRKLRTIEARACIVACPKAVAKIVLSDVGREQAYAMSRLKYRAYLVANVILNRRVRSSSYELFSITGEVPTDARRDHEARGFTDLTFGGWAHGDRAERSVLTLYKGLPYDGARQFLFNPNAHDKHKARFESSLEKLLPALGLSTRDVAALRLTRWGHALPASVTGLLGSGYLAQACAPIGGRIFFAGQDNWASPCFETAIETAVSAAAAARKALG